MLLSAHLCRLQEGPIYVICPIYVPMHAALCTPLSPWCTLMPFNSSSSVWFRTTSGQRFPKKRLAIPAPTTKQLCLSPCYFCRRIRCSPRSSFTDCRTCRSWARSLGGPLNHFRSCPIGLVAQAGKLTSCSGGRRRTSCNVQEIVTQC